MTLQEPSGLLEEGQAGHTLEKGLGTAESVNKNLVNLSLTRPGIGRDGESHSIQYLLTVLPDALLCAQQCHNIPYH